MSKLELTANWTPFLPHQWDHFTFDPKDRLEVSACLGGWGSGKTHEMVRKGFLLSSMNPWTPAYGNSNPLGVIDAPTFRILMQSTMSHFDQLVPRQAVLRRRGPPHNDVLMSNGFRWLLHSGEGEMEGITACVYLIDEIHRPVYSSNPRRYLNALARLRDPNSPRMGMVVAGLPESGWVRDTFDVTGHQNRITVLGGVAGNPYIPPETLQQYYDACPSGHEKTLLGGQWMPPQGAIYPQFDAVAHIVEDPGQHERPTHVGIDIGNFGAILFAQDVTVQTRNVVGQTSTETGLLIVDQMLTQDESVDRMCYRIKTETPWFIHPQKSVFCVDPTVRRDELISIRKHYPGARVRATERGEEFFPVENGIRQVQRGLRDSLGNVRLRFSRKVAGVPHGVIDFLQRYRRNDTTQEPVKDNARDHVGDALRYLVCELLRNERPQAVVF